MNIEKNDLENNNKPSKKANETEVKIKYDVITPEELDPKPKDFDEIEY
ncbi:hypothetical protein [Anaerobacillus alkaliphilus]|nr:hypothetical protein [Anaerobacillus alkaliphilus]